MTDYPRPRTIRMYRKTYQQLRILAAISGKTRADYLRDLLNDAAVKLWDESAIKVWSEEDGVITNGE